MQRPHMSIQMILPPEPFHRILAIRHLTQKPGRIRIMAREMAAQVLPVLEPLPADPARVLPRRVGAVAARVVRQPRLRGEAGAARGDLAGVGVSAEGELPFAAAAMGAGFAAAAGGARGGGGGWGARAGAGGGGGGWREVGCVDAGQRRAGGEGRGAVEPAGHAWGGGWNGGERGVVEAEGGVGRAARRWDEFLGLLLAVVVLERLSGRELRLGGRVDDQRRWERRGRGFVWLWRIREERWVDVGLVERRLRGG